MSYNPKLHHRRSIRLRGYDYSQQGAYFITLCLQNRRHLFGRVHNKTMLLSAMGQIAHQHWVQLTERWPHLELGEFQVMPNHFHGVLIVGVPVGVPLAGTQTPDADPAGEPLAGSQERAPARGAPTAATGAPTIGEIIGAYKSLVATDCLKLFKKEYPGKQLGKFWQRDYWEHIIRDQRAFDNISRYIVQNPAKWDEDRFYEK
jgi:REP element-mobilizing transposase RayT